MKDHRPRIPVELHERIKRAAAAAHRSVNAQIIWYIEQGLEQEGHE